MLFVIAADDFELALTVVEDGVVADYAAIEQTPHLPPTNDSCDSKGVVQPHEKDLTHCLATERLRVPTFRTWAAPHSMKTSDRHGWHGSDLDPRYAVASGARPHGRGLPGAWSCPSRNP